MIQGLPLRASSDFGIGSRDIENRGQARAGRGGWACATRVLRPEAGLAIFIAAWGGAGCWPLPRPPGGGRAIY